VRHNLHYRLGNARGNSLIFYESYSYFPFSFKTFYQAINYTRTGELRIGKSKYLSRLFAQIGNNLPFESALFMAGANPEQLIENKFTRSSGILPKSIFEYNAQNNFYHAAGGLNLRGYAGYILPYSNSYSQYLGIYSNSGISYSGEFHFPDFLFSRTKTLKKYFDFSPYVFSDMAMYLFNNRGFEFSNIKSNLGLGTQLTIKKWGVLETANPLTLRFDFPLFLTPAPNADLQNIKFRWVFSIGKSIN
jgi:hypothetical protein